MKIYKCFPGGRFKALTMSYDDGYTEDEKLVAIFNQYGIKGTFNLNSGMFEETYRGHKRVPKERIPELYKGHEVATHGYTHSTIARCPLAEAAKDILRDREELEAVTGNLVRGHAYPNGSYNTEIKVLLKQLGIAYGRVAESSPQGRNPYALPDDPMEWYPTCHHSAPDLMERGKWLIEDQKSWHLKLMYVWGHSFEFAEGNNWEIIEDFCKLMSGHDDIWYATNIEIIDYMEVLNRLCFSADGRCVYNPSVQSAWLQVNGEQIVEVPGGEITVMKNGKEIARSASHEKSVSFLTDSLLGVLRGY